MQKMNRNRKSVIVYVFTALFALLFDRIYSLFSHGVASASMSLMWVWLLCFGAAVYILIELLSMRTKKHISGRLPMNIYNSGTAVFTVGMLLDGILEIAGTGSEYISIYRFAGILLMITGCILLPFQLRR